MNKEDLEVISHVRDGLKDTRAVAGEMYAAKDEPSCPELLRGWYKAGFYEFSGTAAADENPDGATEALFKDKDEAVLWAYFRNHSLEILEMLRLMVRRDNEPHTMTLEDLNILAEHMSLAVNKSYARKGDGKCGAIGTDRMGHCLRCGREIGDLADLPECCLRNGEMDNRSQAV